MNNRLYRSPTDRVIAGVAGGMAVWLNIDPSLIRIAWVLLGIFSGGIFAVVYIVMMIVVPLPPAGWVPVPGGIAGQGPGPTAGWGAATPPTGPSGAAPDWTQPPGAPAAPGSGWGSGFAPGATPGAPPGAGLSPSGQRNLAMVAGVVLILLGAWFLVDQFVDIRWDLVWPVVVIAIGVGIIVAAVRRREG